LARSLESFNSERRRNLELINFEIMKHPINWVTVMLMVFIASAALHLLLKYQTAPE